MGILAFILFFLLICVLYSSAENHRKSQEHFFEQLNENLNNISKTLKE